MNPFRLARYEAGLSLEDAAHKSGLSVKTISKLENGGHNPKAPTVKSLADAYGVTVRALLGEEAAA